MNQPLRLPDLPFSRITLANGLDVIAMRAGLLSIVSVNLWYHVGSKNEERTQRGYAHLFEHLMFEGSLHYPGDYFQPLQRLGASVNGSTSPDRTNYFVDLPAAHAELAVAMESDRMANLLPALTDEKVRIQKDVVKNEYRQNYENRPYGKVSSLIAQALYPPDHPYSWLTIGSMEDVERASRDDIHAFFKRFYVPSNASLAIVGDIDPNRAFALADRYFGPIPGGTKSLPISWADEPRLATDCEIVVHDRVELDRIYMTWPSVRNFDPREAPRTILADVLARGRSSRLYRKLVMEEELVQDVSVSQSGREIAGTFSAVATLSPGRDVNEARARIVAEIAEIAERGVEADELARVQNGRLAGFVYALDNVGGFGGVADRLNAYNVYLGDPAKVTGDFARYRDVTAENVREAARELLGEGSAAGGVPGRVVVTVLGRKPPTVSPPLDRAIRPSPAPPAQFRAPLPEVRTLACGVPLWVLPRRDLPIVAATAVAIAGASVHGPDLGGLASLTAHVMDEATTRRTSHQIAEEAEGLGTSLSSNCGWDGSYVTMQCLSPHLDRSLDLAIDVLLNPTFPQADFDRMAHQTLTGLRAERDHADSLAARAFLRAIYSEGHTYRTPVPGEEATVKALGRDDAQDFHRRHYRPDRSALVVAGDVDPDDLAAKLDRLLTGWEGVGPDRPVLPAVTAGDRPRILLVNRPGSPQASVRIGHVGPSRLDPDHDALMIFNQILGGQFTSRLNAKLREEKGFTYGIRSHFDGRRGPGPFTISASLQADKIAEALEDIRGEVAAILDHRPPTLFEMDDARRALIEGQARHFETPSSLVARYGGLFLYDLPLDDHLRLADRLKAVTIDGMQDAARRHLRPESFVYVVVADAFSVADDLARLGWAEVETAP